jgi:sorbitol/mannitol transport system substrate-binding protein
MAVLASAGALLLVGACGAGSKTAVSQAKKVDCSVTAPSKPTTVNVLAYNSSAIDPFTNTLVASCSSDKLTIKHDPIDFPGQVQKTAATLAGSSGTYDLVETYSAAIPKYAQEGKLIPLDDLLAKYKDKYDLGGLDQTMIQGMSYGGKVYGLPTQANVSVMAYRKDILDELKIPVPTDFAQLKAAAAKIQASGKMKYPIAMPLLASGDISTRYRNGLNSLGISYVDPTTKRSTFTSPEAKEILTTMKGLTPYMDPQVTTFDQPKVQQQLFNGQAAIATMYSGRMVDLVNSKNTKYADKFGFAETPTLKPGGKPWSTVSVDGWSIPANTKVDKDLLFQMMAASVSEKAGKQAIPAAYPSRKGLADESTMPWFNAIESSINKGAKTPVMEPWSGALEVATREYIAAAITGRMDIDTAAAKAQQAADKVLAESAG